MIATKGKIVGEYKLTELVSKDNNEIEMWLACKQPDGNAKYRIMVAAKEHLINKEMMQNFMGMKEIYSEMRSDNIMSPVDLIESKNWKKVYR